MQVCLLRNRGRILLASLVTVALLIVACGREDGKLAGAISSTARHGSPVAAPVSLPAPSTLLRRASGGTGDRNLTGSEFDAGLPKARVFASGADLSFAPAGSALSSAAYAVFHFDLPAYAGTGVVATSWDSLPAASDYYLGIADFATNRWAWLSGDPGSAMTLPGTLNFKSPSGQVYVVVLLAGGNVHALQEIEFGNNAVPVAVLHAQYSFADPFVQIKLDASASSDDGTIAQYEWDLDGDGSFEANTGTTPTNTISFPLAGTRTVGLRVTDDGGLSSVATQDIKIDSNGYDEVEPNNDTSSLNDLPGIDFTGWEGNLGPGVGGYDGSSEDLYRLVVDRPCLLELTLSSQWVVNFDVKVLDSAGNNILADSNYGQQHATVRLRVTEPGEYIIDCNTPELDQYDYQLSCEATYSSDYDEVENNDDLAAANAANPVGTHKYWGNMGPGGYDGDSDDYWKLDVSTVPTHYTFDLNFNELQGALSLDLQDAAGGVLRYGTYSVDQSEVRCTIDTAGSYYLHLHPLGDSLGGNVDYTLSVRNDGPPALVNLTASPDSGADIPLQVTLDASDVTPPDAFAVPIAYHWDYNNDGLIDHVTDSGTSSVVVTYYAPGNFNAAVYVDLSNGSGGEDSVALSIGGNGDEIEPNDDFPQAQGLILPFNNFLGDVGTGGNDGGAEDIFSFTVGDNQTANFSLEYEAGMAPINFVLLSWDGVDFTILEASQTGSGNEFLSHFFSTGGTYYVGVGTDPGWPSYCGYKLAGSAS